jgi:ribosome-associated protein
MEKLIRQANDRNIICKLIDYEPSLRDGCLFSATLQAEGEDLSLKALQSEWEGSVLWVAQKNPFRPWHRRKNWFVGVHFIAPMQPQQVDERQIVYETHRASGPGGQNVNKLSTAAQLRFDTRKVTLPEDASLRLNRLAGQRMTKEGVIVIHAQRFRTQERNRQDALERLYDLIERAKFVPKTRRATKPTRASKERRLVGKAVRSTIKQGRGRVRADD